MSHDIGRRDFLKTVPIAAGTLAVTSSPATQSRRPADIRIGAGSYTPADYPIQAKPYWDVALSDDFWRPKVVTNAEITIPFEVRKGSDGDREFGGNVLEAAMLSLKTHPNAALQ